MISEIDFMHSLLRTLLSFTPVVLSFAFWQRGLGAVQTCGHCMALGCLLGPPRQSSKQGDALGTTGLVPLCCALFFMTSTHTVNAEEQRPVRPPSFPVSKGSCCQHTRAELPDSPRASGTGGKPPGWIECCCDFSECLYRFLFSIGFCLWPACNDHIYTLHLQSMLRRYFLAAGKSS